jgi:hypothetical protein
MSLYKKGLVVGLMIGLLLAGTLGYTVLEGHRSSQAEPNLGVGRPAPDLASSENQTGANLGTGSEQSGAPNLGEGRNENQGSSQPNLGSGQATVQTVSDDKQPNLGTGTASASLGVSANPTPNLGEGSPAKPAPVATPRVGSGTVLASARTVATTTTTPSPTATPRATGTTHSTTVASLPPVNKGSRPETRALAQTSPRLKQPARRQPSRSSSEKDTVNCSFDQTFIDKLNTHGEWLHRHDAAIITAQATADQANARGDMAIREVGKLREEVTTALSATPTPTPTPTLAPTVDPTATPAPIPTTSPTAAPAPKETAKPETSEDRWAWIKGAIQAIIDMVADVVNKLGQVIASLTRIEAKVDKIEAKISGTPAPAPTTSPTPQPSASPVPDTTPTATVAPSATPVPGATATPTPAPQLPWDQQTTGVGALG